MYRNLKAQMVLENLTNIQLAACIGTTRNTFRDKLNCKSSKNGKNYSDFTVGEANKIRDTYFKEIAFDELFKKSMKGE